MLFLVFSASAASLALLPLDARGVGAEAAERATDALRDALMVDGMCDIPTGSAIAAALGAGHEADLKRARERYATGRAATAKGDPRTAVAALQESLALHEALGAAWSRRGELADGLWALADAHLRAGDPLQAREALTDLARLWPGYATDRAHHQGTAARILAELEAGVAKEPWRLPSDDAIDAVFASLGVDWLAFGVVEASGQITVRVLGPGGDNATIREIVPLPVDPADDAWSGIASRIAGAARGAEPAPPDEPEAEDEAAPETAARNVETAARGGSERPVTIREIDTRPITARWWFWTAVAGFVVGGTAVGVAVGSPAPVETVQEAATWSVTVEAP